MENTREIPMQFHPRIFAAFGADLVTNDAVAVTELVKNCYDAYAYNVSVIFGKDDLGEAYIEIADDGLGMSQSVIAESWAVIATPYKAKNPIVERDGKIRRVSGNKGLGRFSAARLGRYLEITTKSTEDICFSAKIDWNAFLNAGNITDCSFFLSPVDEPRIKDTGTIIRISGLSIEWTDKEIFELKGALARLISPFEKIADFNIELIIPGQMTPIKIEPHAFIRIPTYCISGTVDKTGCIEWKYRYAPKGVVSRNCTSKTGWEDAKYGFDTLHTIKMDDADSYCGGPFSFEIRAWDLDTDSIGNVADTFDIGRREVRSNIAQYKGLSIYRDNVLVLPKSDASKDWLGIDLRRVSYIGKRISTNQIVGMVNISSKDNPEIKDTTDREKLVDTIGYKQFCRLLETIISVLENNRNVDKSGENRQKKTTLSDLIAPLSAQKFEHEIESMVQSGVSGERILDAVRTYSADTEKNLGVLNERLTYYAQTASLGSVAVVILHEVLTGMTVIKRFLTRLIKQKITLDNKTNEYFHDAEIWHERLVAVAKSFAPLYRKNLLKEKHLSNVAAEVQNSVRLISGKKESKNIRFDIEIDSSITTSMHPGELQTILVNLLDNACYWTAQTNREKIISITANKDAGSNTLVTVSDTGLGVAPSDAESIFQPGITAKPHGIGMGLVIVTELLNNHGCKISTTIPGELGGATFSFDLP